MTCCAYANCPNMYIPNLGMHMRLIDLEWPWWAAQCQMNANLTPMQHHLSQVIFTID